MESQLQILSTLLLVLLTSFCTELVRIVVLNTLTAMLAIIMRLTNTRSLAQDVFQDSLFLMPQGQTIVFRMNVLH